LIAMALLVRNRALGRSLLDFGIIDFLRNLNPARL
jgi:hypothetical protein